MEVLHLGNGTLSLGGSGIAPSQQHGPHAQKEIPSASNSMPFGQLLWFWICLSGGGALPGRAGAGRRALCCWLLAGSNGLEPRFAPLLSVMVCLGSRGACGAVSTYLFLQNNGN